MRTMPKLVKVNRNTMAAADATAGRIAAHVTRVKALQRDAPSTRAASSVLGSRPSHRLPTVRTTTAWLKNAWAITIATALPRRSTPSTPRGPSNDRNAAATTTVGSTNGTTSSAWSSRRPRNS
jgi:hypothetical protein